MYTYTYIYLYFCAQTIMLHVHADMRVYVCVSIDKVYTRRHLYILLHLECHLISFSNLNRIGLFSTERGKRDVEN